MISVFAAETADKVWRAAARAVMSEQALAAQQSRAGETRELLHVTLEIQDPRQRWIVSRQPAMNPAFAIAEVLWILAGRADAAFLNFWNPTLPVYAGTGDRYSGAYGERLRVNWGFDQIENARRALAANPSSRQVVLQIWDAARDLPDAGGVPRHPDLMQNRTAVGI